MPTFRKAPDEVADLVQECKKLYRPDLADAGVTIGSRFAHAKTDEETGEPKGPALKHHGYPALAIVRITQQKDRVIGLPDAIIDFDGDQWDTIAEDRRRSLIDHELTHLVLVRDKEGAIALDDCFRPKLKMRPHDAQLGIFWEVVERHGPASCEADAYKPIHKEFTQRLFPWG